MPAQSNKTDSNTRRILAHVRGRVQGVGFRPTVYRYARELGLTGTVRNDSGGVVIDIQGATAKIDSFLKQVRDAPPPQAQITEMETYERSPTSGTAFEIIPSTRSDRVEAGMPPDLATCEDCRHELFDPEDRRHNYPFLNCTNCGPRFTIIRELPYDREKTAMADFEMCAACRAEYENPENRRFDAQPNACPVCGPKLKLQSADGSNLPGNPIDQTANLIEAGAILAVKGLGGYHLCCSALDDAPIAALRKRKNRSNKAFAVMFASLDELQKYAEINQHEKEELQSPARPIVIVKLRHPAGKKLSALVSPDTPDIGAFLPYTPLHHLLLQKISPLIMTSANLSEDPIVSTRKELEKLMGKIADYVLDHDRDIIRRCDDSVVKINRGERLFIRRSRGFVPNPVPLPDNNTTPVFACGADLKNTFCIAVGRNAYISQHIGDLKDYNANRFYEQAAADLIRLLQAKPGIIAHDMHPAYQSTAYAKTVDSSKKTVAVQHHHAHIASCMADNNHNSKVIGVALDGTGFGPDNTIWGGEFMVADLSEFDRVGHFKTYPMPGGEAATQNPERMALSILTAEGFDVSGEHCPKPIAHIPRPQRRLLSQIITRQVNAPLTSSAGRLFDAIAALLGLCRQADYEGQAPMRLQAIADITTTDRVYPYAIDERNVISFGPAIRKIMEDLEQGTAASLIAGMFHRTVAAAVIEICTRIGQAEKLDTAALSGGVFQNELLLNLITDGLESRGLQVLRHRQVPPNDAGISLGQAAVARSRRPN